MREIEMGAVVFVGYVVACWWWPFTRCGWCHGGGRKTSPSGKAWRACWWCKGSGTRVRWGRRVFGGVGGP